MIKSPQFKSKLLFLGIVHEICIKKIDMKKNILVATLNLLILMVNFAFAQEKELNCFEKYERAFKERGSYVISDNIYTNVMISFFEGDEAYCVRGKVRVEKGYITSIFYYFDDNTEKLYEKKFQNLSNEPPTISNGISEMIVNADKERFRIVFVDKLKPKRRKLQEMTVPDDL